MGVGFAQIKIGKLIWIKRLLKCHLWVSKTIAIVIKEWGPNGIAAVKVFLHGDFHTEILQWGCANVVGHLLSRWADRIQNCPTFIHYYPLDCFQCYKSSFIPSNSIHWCTFFLHTYAHHNVKSNTTYSKATQPSSCEPVCKNLAGFESGALLPNVPVTKAQDMLTL